MTIKRMIFWETGKTFIFDKNGYSFNFFSHSDQKAQPWGGLKADFSEAFRPTGSGGARAEPPLTIILIKSRLTVRRTLGSF